MIASYRSLTDVQHLHQQVSANTLAADKKTRNSKRRLRGYSYIPSFILHVRPNNTELELVPRIPFALLGVMLSENSHIDDLAVASHVLAP